LLLQIGDVSSGPGSNRETMAQVAALVQVCCPLQVCNNSALLGHSGLLCYNYTVAIVASAGAASTNSINGNLRQGLDASAEKQGYGAEDGSAQEGLRGDRTAEALPVARARPAWLSRSAHAMTLL
jgi:hypothetical protein